MGKIKAKSMEKLHGIRGKCADYDVRTAEDLLIGAFERDDCNPMDGLKKERRAQARKDRTIQADSLGYLLAREALRTAIDSLVLDAHPETILREARRLSWRGWQ